MTLLKEHSLASNSQPKASGVAAIIEQINKLDESDLLQVRTNIDALLKLDLDSLDLNEELNLQYRQAKSLLLEVQKDNSVPANQKAQMFNAARAQLADIIKQQESVWGMQRLKKFEVAFVKAANLLTEEARAAFFDLYGEYLKDPADAQA